MRRKVVQQGPATLMVSLPSKWAKKYGIKRGDEINVEEDGSNIILKTSFLKEEAKSKTLKFKRKEKYYLRSVIAAAYREGYDQLNLQFDEKVPIVEIQDIVSTLFGFEIIEERQSSCIIKSVLNEKDEARTIINKLFQIVKLINENYKYYFDNNFSEMIDLDYMHNKTIMNRDYCKRIINSVYSSKEEISLMHDIVFILDKLSGISIYMLKYLIKNKIKSSRQMKELLSKNHDMFNDLYSSFVKKDFDLSSKLYIELHEMIREKYLEGLYAKLSKDKNYEPQIIASYFYQIELLYALVSRLQGINV